VTVRLETGLLPRSAPLGNGGVSNCHVSGRVSDKSPEDLEAL